MENSSLNPNSPRKVKKSTTEPKYLACKLEDWGSGGGKLTYEDENGAGEEGDLATLYTRGDGSYEFHATQSVILKHPRKLWVRENKITKSMIIFDFATDSGALERGEHKLFMKSFLRV